MFPLALPAEVGVKTDAEGEALSWNQSQWQGQSSYAKPGAGDVGLCDGQAGAAGVGQRLR